MADIQPSAGAPAAPPPLAHEPNAATAAPVAVAPVVGSPDAGGDAQEAPFHPPVPAPSEYQLPSWQAQQRGLPVDFVAEREMREAFHAAGVDQNLAASLYSAALAAAGKESTPLSMASDYVTGERSLRQAWGGEFDANLRAANEEGRLLFEAMPASIRRGMSYREFALASGLANSAPIAKMLLLRARTRGGSSKTGG
ncbi:MAG: hypothetical protein J7598_03570 [Mitsuaria chitosanitabida]|uniref:hypothetical protein n=1 Tax=Roseateles chitosanitabidus TaxID=65048 RepID=UPI001B0BD616|nr:hypothetical protein [Roseateles chitosanitabidus]MBO9685669.1 hypothetical protein [Roseateles chitosanitabidus]